MELEARKLTQQQDGREFKCRKDKKKKKFKAND